MYPCSLIIAVRVSSNCATFSRLLSRSNTRTTRMNNASRLIASRPRRLADTTPLFPDFSTREKRLLALFFFLFFLKSGLRNTNLHRCDIRALLFERKFENRRHIASHRILQQGLETSRAILFYLGLD